MLGLQKKRHQHVMRCLPEDSEDRSYGQQSPLIRQVFLGGVLDFGGPDIALHPAVMRAHQEDESQEEAGEKSTSVSKVVDVREDAYGKVNSDDDQEGHQGCSPHILALVSKLHSVHRPPCRLNGNK